jgi:hypothetical protein
MLDDRDMWDGLHQAQRESRARNRNAVTNTLRRNNLLDRAEFINEGTVKVWGFTYYAQSKKVRAPWGEMFQAKGVQDFVDSYVNWNVDRFENQNR